MIFLSIPLRRSFLFVCFVFVSLILSTPNMLHAGLVPAGDFQGKSLNDWGIDYSVWAFQSGLGVPPAPPDMIDGARLLPPNFLGGDFEANITISAGTAIVGSPFFLGGERYDDGTSDLIPNLNDFVHTLLDDVTFTTKLDGVVVLVGKVTDFPDRIFGPFVLPDPITYATPIPRGSVNAIEAIFMAGIATIFDDLAVGHHTIVNSYDSPNFFGSATYTYNITVVPEPASVVTIGSAAMLLAVWRGRKRKVLSTS